MKSCNVRHVAVLCIAIRTLITLLFAAVLSSVGFAEPTTDHVDNAALSAKQAPSGSEVGPSPSDAIAEADKSDSTQRPEAEKQESQVNVKPIDTGHVFEFNGYDSYVDVAHVPFDSFAAFTIEAWVKGWNAMLVYEGKQGDPENSVWLGWEALGWISGWEADGGQDYVYRVDRELPEGWAHLALVCDGKNQYLFIDGKQIHKIAAPKPGEMVKDRPLLVGGQQTWKADQTGPTQRNGFGFLAALRISSKALYTEPFTPPAKLTAEKDTELLYDLSRKDGKTIDDLSSKKRHGKIHNVKWLPRADADR